MPAALPSSHAWGAWNRHTNRAFLARRELTFHQGSLVPWNAPPAKGGWSIVRRQYCCSSWCSSTFWMVCWRWSCRTVPLCSFKQHHWWYLWYQPVRPSWSWAPLFWKPLQSSLFLQAWCLCLRQDRPRQLQWCRCHCQARCQTRLPVGKFQDWSPRRLCLGQFELNKNTQKIKISLTIKLFKSIKKIFYPPFASLARLMASDARHSAVLVFQFARKVFSFQLFQCWARILWM